MADEYKYDVFISYSSAIKDWVRKDLLDALENAGLKVCIDFRDFKAGKPAIKNMRDSILESRHTLLILTKAFIDSGWTDFENMLSQTIDPANRAGRIIPLLKEKCELPLEIGYLTYVNFVDPDDWNIAWKQLFTALGKPDAPIPTTAQEEAKLETSPNWYLAHPYPMPPNFTGRETEREMLTNWLEDDNESRLFILCALGGFGKSALAWHWLTHDVNAKKWPKIIWWSFYEGDASFENFIKETLEYLNMEVPAGQRQQVDALLKAMQTHKAILIMDGFERVLRAYSSMTAAYQSDEELDEGEISQRDCVNINAEIFLKNLCVLPNIKGKVLMTTRLTPRAVEQRGELLGGCHEEELQAMQKEDAVNFIRAQGIRGARAEIEAACEPYGYHPLSLRILAGLIANDRETPGDIAVAGKLDIVDDLIANRNHILKVAYNTLSPEQQKLLSHIACFRSAMTYNALKAISTSRGDPSGSDETSESIKAGRPYDGLDADLKTLEHRGLLHWDKTTNKYDLHPIVRRYAYERLTAPDRTAAHTRLRNYFEAVPKPEKIETLEDLAPVIELYHHMVRAGNLDEACDLLYERLIPNPLFYQFGAYQLCIELMRALFLDGEDKPPRLKNESDQGWALNTLASVYSLSGQPRRAVHVFQSGIISAEKLGDKKNAATGMVNVAQDAQLPIGALREAERNLHRLIDLCREIENEFEEANGHRELGRILSYRGVWQEAEQESDKSIELAEKQKHVQMQGVTWSYRALHFLLMAREEARKSNNEYRISAIECAQRTLELADEQAKDFPVPRDYVRVHQLLGAAYRANNELTLAEENLFKALNLCRQINLVDREADILLELAKLRYAQEKTKESKTLAEEALLITERSGYVLQGADVHLFLAQLALEQEKDKEKAKELAERAKELAYCDGPPYYYKVAYEEAEKFIAQLKD